jgi:RNA polymerase sigma factor (sigma-70 family)
VCFAKEVFYGSDCCGLDLCDLISYAWMGWRRAKMKYNPERGVPFKVFAKKYICGSIKDGIRSYRPGYLRNQQSPKVLNMGDLMPLDRSPEVFKNPGLTTERRQIAEQLFQDILRAQQLFQILVDVLPKQEKNIMKKYSVYGYSYQEIASEIGDISRKVVSKKHHDALDKIIHHLTHLLPNQS